MSRSNIIFHIFCSSRNRWTKTGSWWLRNIRCSGAFKVLLALLVFDNSSLVHRSLISRSIPFAALVTAVFIVGCKSFDYNLEGYSRNFYRSSIDGIPYLSAPRPSYRRRMYSGNNIMLTILQNFLGGILQPRIALHILPWFLEQLRLPLVSMELVWKLLQTATPLRPLSRRPWNTVLLRERPPGGFQTIPGFRCASERWEDKNLPSHRRLGICLHNSVFYRGTFLHCRGDRY